MTEMNIFIIKFFNHKSMIAIIFLMVFLSMYISAVGHIKIICTAALLENQYEQRKQEYMKAIQAVRHCGFMPFIVESCQKGPSFLDELVESVWYAKTNNTRLRNKGVNEVKSLLSFFNQFKFEPEDIIVKITGRYILLDDSFFRFIAEHLDGDAFVKYFDDQVFTGCFAVRYKYFIDFLWQLDLENMER